MKNDLIFFAGSGQTSTSANHVANMAKEYTQSLEKRLAGIAFHEESVQLIGATKTTVIQEGTKEKVITEIPSMLSQIAQAKSLIAWLREAIKARQNLIEEVNGMGLEEFCGQQELEYPKRPEADAVLTEDEYYGGLNIKERNRYYQLETEAAVLGKYIHPQGAYAEARNRLKEIANRPHRVDGKGRDALIYTYKPTVDEEVVERQFFELQKRHREVQAALNAIKFECEKAVVESRTASSSKFAAEMSVYQVRIQELSAAMKDWQHKRVREIGRLKIVIPDSLQDIYQTVSGLGK